MFVWAVVVFFNATENITALHSIKSEMGQKFPAKCQNRNEFDQTCFPNSTSAQRDCKTFKCKTSYAQYTWQFLQNPCNSKGTAPTKSMTNLSTNSDDMSINHLFAGNANTNSERITEQKKDVKNAHMLAQGETIIGTCLPLGHMLFKLTIASCFHAF